MSLTRLREVAHFRPALIRALGNFDDNAEIHDVADSLLHLLDANYDLWKVMADGVEYDAQSQVSKMQNALRYQKRRRKMVEAELDLERNPHRGKLVQSLWFVRIGMASPSIPARTLASILADIPQHESAGVSHWYIGRVRDAFAELLKLLQVAELSRQVFDLESSTIVLSCRA